MDLQFLNPLAKKSNATDQPERRSMVRRQKHNSVSWIDIQNPKRKELNQLAEEFSFDPLHLEACIQKGQLDQLEITEKYIFVLLRSPKYSQAENKFVTTKTIFFIGKNYLVTVNNDSHSLVSALFTELEQDEKKQEEFFKKSPAHCLYKILITLVEDIARLQDVLLKEVDEIEDLVFDVNVSGAYNISQLRQKMIRLRRVHSSFRNVLQELSASKSNLLENSTRHFTSVTMNIKRLAEILDEAKETVEIYKDADFTVSTERTNKILGILTIIFTLGMPATIVGSFYGMNILVPGGIEAGSWTFWGPFTTFYFVLLMAIGPVVLMLLWFKYKQWF